MKYEIIIYTDARGRAPLRDYLKELKSQKDNDSRIRASKIQDYISLLQEKGICYQSQYASIFRTKSIPGCGSFGRVVTGYYFLPGLVVHLYSCMHSGSKARRHLIQNSTKQSESIKTG